MTYTIRVSLPGTNALEASPDPRDYSLLADDDNILLKEESRGSGNGNQSISHNLGYIPFYLAYGEVTSGKWRLNTGWVSNPSSPRTKTTTSTLTIEPDPLATGDLKWFIFYDDMN